MKTSITELIPTSSRKSFYGKAKVIETNGRKYLRSYDTVVASVNENGDVERHSDWLSKTTCSHVKSFIETFGNGKVDAKKFRNMPMTSVGEITVTL